VNTSILRKYSVERINTPVFTELLQPRKVDKEKETHEEGNEKERNRKRKYVGYPSTKVKIEANEEYSQTSRGAVSEPVPKDNFTFQVPSAPLSSQ
jgi:hypothetical protein